MQIAHDLIKHRNFSQTKGQLLILGFKWPYMNDDIDNYLEACVKCKSTKANESLELPKIYKKIFNGPF
jgi:hypothetical protein